MPEKKIPGCLVAQEIDRIVQLSTDLAGAVRSLRARLALCEECPHQPECRLRETVRSQIVAAINDVTLEWEL
jgi:hypothetical protein